MAGILKRQKSLKEKKIFKKEKVLNKGQIMKSLKIALAAVLSIALAGELGLKYSATAGIITVLSIQNTKRETLRSARNRGLAFVCALLLSAGAYKLLGFTLPAFAVYLLLFAFLCLAAGWTEAIAMDSVLTTHFLTEQSMEISLLLNETGLFLIGTGMGILVNLHLKKKEIQFALLADEVDNQIKGILHRMSVWLPEEDKSGYGSDCFLKLQQSIEGALACAAANYNNTLFGQNTKELEYIRMREQQSVVLQGIYENIKSISYLPRQAKQVAELLAEIEKEYHRDNTVEELLERLELLFREMEQEPLPIERREFEARAILFYILKQLEKLLLLKRNFFTIPLTNAKPMH